jgi:proteasome lid subunit RPN8/RPN11
MIERSIVIPREVLHCAYMAARNAFPAECCGWLTGPKGEDTVDNVRACVNEADSSVAYTMSEAAVMDMVSSFGGDNPAKIVFHSHPRSNAFWSSVDQHIATLPFGDCPTYPVQQLVIGLDGNRIKSAILFTWREETKSYEEAASYTGAAL